MERKGDLLNQLAIISDLIENINLETNTKKVLIDLNKAEFDKVYKSAIERTKFDIPNDGNEFTITIGEIDFIFNTNSV